MCYTTTLFKILSQQWKNDTRFLSNVTTIIEHPAYQQIIDMGTDVVPLIIHDLVKNGPNHWFTALSEITGHNPITNQIAGDMDKMSNAWINWYNKQLHVIITAEILQLQKQVKTLKQESDSKES